MVKILTPKKIVQNIVETEFEGFCCLLEQQLVVNLIIQTNRLNEQLRTLCVCAYAC